MSKDKSLFKSGLKDGLPIGVGYFPLAFTLGIGGSKIGLKLFHSLSMAVLSFTGVGQKTAMDLISEHEQFIGFFLALLVINLRNIVLSLTMAPRLDPKTSLVKKLILAMGNTDEIFALTIRREGKIPANYFLGVMTIPYFAWFLGVFIGGVAGDLLPGSVITAMSMALYAMLIAAVVPATKESRPVLYVATISGFLSCMLQWLRDLLKNGTTPIGNFLSGLLQPGGIIIIGSLLSAMIIAWKFPTKVEEAE